MPHYRIRCHPKNKSQEIVKGVDREILYTKMSSVIFVGRRGEFLCHVMSQGAVQWKLSGYRDIRHSSLICNDKEHEVGYVEVMRFYDKIQVLDVTKLTKLIL
ncbi:hypothetical protein CR513_26286, partial [Mucuna pruriens]